ncbi:MAG TPA: macro domain-containing protein [Dokdonella sp.]|uniref:macro domain-containing protein n=1 Tax=Dokdonella sp. TaxID=2291710 RepID=UPI002BFB770C|nr:macro domain-containing protein [Dokdonella sp.]HUD43611.1 macro domain-containing protein [Dokdonella sp.]
MQIHLCTLDATMAEAWRIAFAGTPVSIRAGDILAEPVDAVVSAANSFGIMDGGLDLHYARHFGEDLERTLRARLAAEHDGELPVGQALIVPTGDRTIPWMVSAPTMRVPMTIDRTTHVYLAFRAALRAVRAHARDHTPIASLACPALGAGVGAMPFERVARQMRAAYDLCIGGDTDWLRSARGVLNQHASLLR